MKTDELIEVVHLDLLDDARLHARCMACFPSPAPLTVIIAWCGERVAWRSAPGKYEPLVAPKGSCEECADWTRRCACCGAA